MFMDYGLSSGCRPKPITGVFPPLQILPCLLSACSIFCYYFRVLSAFVAKAKFSKCLECMLVF